MPSGARLDSEAMPATQGSSNAPFFAFAEEQEVTVSKLAAVLGTSAADRNHACELLRSLGYETVSFELREDLVASLLYRGTCFDLLVASLNGDGHRPSCDAQVLRSAVGTDVPLLLIVREAQLHTSVASAIVANADFILAPCNPLEFEARLTRLRISTTSREWEKGFRCGSYHFHLISRTVHFQGKRVKLKPLEFNLACRLFRNPWIIHSRHTLFHYVWGQAPLNDETRTLNVHIASLRKKLDLGPDRECDLRVVFNVGYQLMFLHHF
jgi:DNA-binding response OmpR family regulator